MIRFPDEVVRQVTFESIRLMMYNQMKANRGEAPEDLENFGERIANLNIQSVEGLFKGTVFATDGSIALLFVSDTMLRAFQHGTKFSMDGTSDVSRNFHISR